jgi:hypothetical protein
MKLKSRYLLLIISLSLLVSCSAETPAPAPQETTSESEYKTTFDYLVFQACASFMYKDYQRASQLFSAVEALADFDAYDGYSIGIAQERENFDAARCY